MPKPQETTLPSSTAIRDVRVLKVGLFPKGEPLFSEHGITVAIEDEGAGEYVVVKSQAIDREEGVCINPDEWPTLRSVIDYMVGQCRND